MNLYEQGRVRRNQSTPPMPPFRHLRRPPASPAPGKPRRRSGSLLLLLHALTWVWACVFPALSLGAEDARGEAGRFQHKPLTRLYTLEEIGCTLSGLQLLHDSHGRVAVAQQNELFVLNDSTWLKLCEGREKDLSFHRVLCAPKGETYFGAFGAWGALRDNGRGELEPVQLVPADAPEWVRTCDFRDILCTEIGVFFWGQSGVVFLDGITGTHSYFQVGNVSGLFPLNGRLIASTFQDGFFTLDLASRSWTPSTAAPGGKPSVMAAAGDGKQALLLGTMEAKFLVLREGRLARVEWNGAETFPGPILSIVALPEGGFAASVGGFGVVLFDNEGHVKRVMDETEFRSISALECTEPGVLWGVTERGVLKILHPQPFSSYGREQGLHVHWPQLVQWKDSTLVSSGGRVFEALGQGSPGGIQFRQLASQPNDLGWGIAAVGESLLLGGGNGVHEVEASGTTVQVLSGMNVARLVAIDEDTCVVIAVDSIAVLRRRGGKWSECAERIPGVGYSYVTHAGKGTAWLELGMNKVARISLSGGKLQARLIEEFPWQEPSWVNVSIVDNTVVFSASSRTSLFLDDRTLEAVEAPELRRLIEQSPYLIQRMTRDEEGTLWLSHSRGLFAARLKEGRYEPDYDAFRAINETVPQVQCLKGSGVWATTDKRLYRLDSGGGPLRPSQVRPVLVALKNTRAGTVLPIEDAERNGLGTLPYSHNSLQLDFFAGSYAWARPFSYEYRLGDAPWQNANAGSSVFLADLPEGSYTLEVRVMDTLGPVGAKTQLAFSVTPPWYRSWIAFLSYPVAAFLLVFLASRYAAHRQRVRLVELEGQVQARTAELRTAMDCLKEETSNSATLAERNRLAGEIHDSLEQGLAGLFLQLESTSRLGACVEPVRSGLQSALGMLHYCREELRNAVRGLHSPVLDNETLERALCRIAGQVAPLAGFARVEVKGTPRRLSPAVEHHLLRIAQEALGNAMKHSGATRVVLMLEFGEEEVRLSVTDDGCGFDPGRPSKPDSPHLGLPGFQSRAMKIGGTVQVDSLPGRGTTVRVVVSEEKTGAPKE